jgi:hypothetical protein
MYILFTIIYLLKEQKLNPFLPAMSSHGDHRWPRAAPAAPREGGGGEPWDEVERRERVCAKAAATRSRGEQRWSDAIQRWRVASSAWNWTGGCDGDGRRGECSTASEQGQRKEKRDSRADSGAGKRKRGGAVDDKARGRRRWAVLGERHQGIERSGCPVGRRRWVVLGGRQQGIECSGCPWARVTVPAVKSNQPSQINSNEFEFKSNPSKLHFMQAWLSRYRKFWNEIQLWSFLRKEELSPLELLQIQNGFWIKKLGIQCLFLNLGN